MPDLLDALRESGGSTEPDSVFRAELMARVRDALAAADVSDHESTLLAASPRDTTHDRRRTSIMAAVAALVAAAIAGIVWYGARRTDEGPATPSVDTSLSDRAYAPLSGEVFAVSQAADGLVLDHRQFAVTENGPRISPPISPPSTVPGPPDRESIVDLWVGVSSVYSVSCCDGGTGTVRRATGADWFDGEVLGPATRFDGNLVVGRGYVDPVTGTVTLGDPGDARSVITEPGAMDVTVLASGVAAVLVGGDDPRVIVYYVAGFSGAPQQRDELVAPDDACAIVGLDLAVVVFSGHSEGDDPCLADHGTALDIASGGTIAEFDLPEPVRNVDSDHAHLMAAVTPGGELWVGTLDPQPAWYRLADGGFLVANLWVPS